VFSGRRDTSTIAIAGTAAPTTALRTFEKLQSWAEAAGGRAAWRSMNISARAPTMSAKERVPTDQASLEAVLGFISPSIVPGLRQGGKGATAIWEGGADLP